MGKPFCRDHLARFHTGKFQHGLPDKLCGFAGSGSQFSDHLLERIMLRRLQWPFCRRALLRLRDRKLIALQQGQHGFQLFLRKLAQGGMTVLLTDKITHRGDYSPAQQLGQLRDNLAGSMLLLCACKTLVQVLFGGRKMARL